MRGQPHRENLLAPGDAIGYDPAAARGESDPPGLRRVPTPAAARAALDPARTVVHLCTPPAVRAEVLEEFAGLGFRLFLVEKPLAVGEAEVERIRRIRDDHGLRLAVVAPWLHSVLTARLEKLVRDGTLGVLRSLSVRQNKPRLTRTFSTHGHPTAFDVEAPHSVGVALRLAGPGRVARASLTDASAGGRTVADMGTARLEIVHDGGVTTTVVSDLTAPVRERSIRLGFSGGTAVGHYPVSGDDSFAQLSVRPAGRPVRQEIFPDETLTACVRHAYRDFADGADLGPAFELQAQVVSLLGDARRRCAGEGALHAG